MQVTIGEVKGPSYEQVEGVGIIPDQEVSLTVHDATEDNDTQLNAGLKALGP
jgi:hypothetical protein